MNDEGTTMKKVMKLVLAAFCLMSLAGCGKELQQGDENVQYFFTAKVIEANEEYLLLEVFDTGNTNLSEGTEVEVSTEVVAAAGCPEFVPGECARVLMARNTEDNPTDRLKALSIYKTDETGNVIADKSESTSKMYIEPAQLTEEEENIAELLELNTKYRIFDFVLDDTVQSIQVNTYRLMDGEWKLETGGGGQAFSDANGRIALGFERLDEGIRSAIQSEHIGGATEYKSERSEDLKEIGGYATSVLSEKTEIVYEEEIPLVIQVITSKNEVAAYQPDYFHYPERYEELGYEGVFAVTIRFSKKTLAELAEQK